MPGEVPVAPKPLIGSLIATHDSAMSLIIDVPQILPCIRKLLIVRLVRVQWVEKKKILDRKYDP